MFFTSYSLWNSERRSLGCVSRHSSDPEPSSSEIWRIRAPWKGSVIPTILRGCTTSTKRWPGEPSIRRAKTARAGSPRRVSPASNTISCQASLQECSILTLLASADVQQVFGIETALRCHRLRALDNRESATGEQQG